MKHNQDKYRAQIDPQRFSPFIDQKLIRVEKHPQEDLYIYNYTAKCQYDRVWTEETMMCRGLILDGKGIIVARPFKKFFNLDEVVSQGKEIPREPFEVFEKLDGSLGILYFQGKIPHLATRGSFTSSQAIKGTEILHSKYDNVSFESGYTYLFEIVYPENRIVVDYKGMSDIFLLTVIDTKTGIEKPYGELHAEYNGILPIVKRFDGIADLSHLQRSHGENSEGYVIHFPQSGLRLKVKHDEYIRIHRLVTGLNSKRIWEYLKDNQMSDELLQRVPDEFYVWVTDRVNELQTEFHAIETAARQTLGMAKPLSTRKEQALLIQQSNYPKVVFAMLDDKNYSEIIWRMIQPKAEKPFREDEA